MITLYYHYQSCSMGPHIMLEEIGCEYSTILVDFSKNEQKSAAYLAVNPNGQVPALNVDGEIIVQNVAIQYYLASVFPEARLKPESPLAEARWLAFISWLSNTLQPMTGQITRTANYADDPVAYPAVKSVGRAKTWQYVNQVEAMLDGRQWIMGDQYTSADPYFLVFVGMLLRNDFAMEELPRIEAWTRRMLARDKIRKVLAKERSVLLDRY